MPARGSGHLYFTPPGHVLKQLFKGRARTLHVPNGVAQICALLLQRRFVRVVPLVTMCLPRGEHLEERRVCASALGDCRAQVGLVLVVYVVHLLGAWCRGGRHARRGLVGLRERLTELVHNLVALILPAALHSHFLR